MYFLSLNTVLALIVANDYQRFSHRNLLADEIYYFYEEVYFQYDDEAVKARQSFTDLRPALLQDLYLHYTKKSHMRLAKEICLYTDWVDGKTPFEDFMFDFIFPYKGCHYSYTDQELSNLPEYSHEQLRHIPSIQKISFDNELIPDIWKNKITAERIKVVLLLAHHDSQRQLYYAIDHNNSIESVYICHDFPWEY